MGKLDDQNTTLKPFTITDLLFLKIFLLKSSSSIPHAKNHFSHTVRTYWTFTLAYLLVKAADLVLAKDALLRIDCFNRPGFAAIFPPTPLAGRVRLPTSPKVGRLKTGPWNIFVETFFGPFSSKIWKKKIYIVTDMLQVQAELIPYQLLVKTKDHIKYYI